MPEGRPARGALIRLAALALGILLVESASPSFAVPNDARPADLRAFLPADDEVPGWRASGAPQEFKGEDLYLYIDGGAEIYREYGFVQVLAQEYKNAGGKGLSVEIFEMSEPAAAYGMYTFKKSANGLPLAAGVEGQAEDYYLNFWSGAFLVTITAYDRDPESRQGLLQAAAAASKRIPRGAERPRLVSALPQSGLVPSSIRYFRGYLGFMNFYSSAGRDEFQAAEGVRGDYLFGASLYILAYRDEQESSSRFEAVKKAVQAGRAAADFKLLAGRAFQMLDGKGKLVAVKEAASKIFVCVAAPRLDLALRLIDEAGKAF